MNYKGYLIQQCGDRTYDILKDGELIEGEFNTILEAQAYIRGLLYLSLIVTGY